MKRLLLILLLLSGIGVYAQNPNDTLPFYSKVKHGVLKNGMTYYVLHNSEPKNRAYLQLVVNAGSVFEDDDQKGLAHLCEHMAFNGTKNFPKHELIKYLESVGMRFGADLNAYTSFDETVYMIEVPLDSVQILENGLKILYDWACNVSYETKEINDERGVVMQEWRLGRGAWDRINRQTFPVLLHGSKYAERLPIGDTAIIQHCPPDNLRRFYRDWYRPDLQAVIVVGDFDADKVEKMVKEMFSKIPARTNERPHVYPEIPNHKQILAKVATDKELPINLFSITIKHDYKPVVTYADFKNELKKDLISEMIQNRLNEYIQNPDASITNAYVYYWHFIGHKAIFKYQAILKNDKIADAVEYSAKLMKSVKEYGFNDDELAKKSLLNQKKNRYQNQNTISSEDWARDLHDNFSVAKYYVLSPKEEYEIYQKILPEIKLDDINKSINEILTDSNMVLTLWTSKLDDNIKTDKDLLDTYLKAYNSEVEKYQTVSLDKSLLPKEPTAGKIVKEETDAVTCTTIWTLSNGIKVVVKPTDFKENQILLLGYSYGGTSLYTGDDIINARMCVSVEKYSGLGNYSAIELDKFLKDKNVSVNPFVRIYDEGFDAKCGNDDFSTMLQMIYAYFMYPRFTDDGFKVAIEKEKTWLENKSNDPQSVWSDSLIATIYNSPYTTPYDLNDLEKLKKDRTEQIYKERFADPGSFTFIIVGSVKPEKIKKDIEKYLGGLPAVNHKEKMSDVKVGIKGGTQIVKVNKGTEPKSMIYLILYDKGKNSLKDEIYRKSFAYILTDTLISQIRENTQWTYSISARSSYLRSMGQYYYSIFYSTSPDKVDTVNSAIIDIANYFKENPIDEKMLKTTVEKLKRQHETNLRKNEYWENELFAMYFYNEKPDFITDYDKIVNSLTVKKLSKAIKKNIPQTYKAIELLPEK